jgi:hypothetical protein
MNKDNNNEEDSSLVADVGGADDNFSVEIGATAYELKQLLKNDKKNEFYAALGVEKNYPEQDQMQLVLAASKTCSSNMKMACENLFTFVSLLAVTTGSKDGMSTIDKLENVALKFDFWMKNCILQEQHREGILHLFPESRWPQDFITHCNVLQDVDPSTTWLKSHHLEKSEKPLSYLKKVCFGYKREKLLKRGGSLSTPMPMLCGLIQMIYHQEQMFLLYYCQSEGECGTVLKPLHWPKRPLDKILSVTSKHSKNRIMDRQLQRVL